MEALTANALLQLEVTESPQNKVSQMMDDIVRANKLNKKWAKPTW